ncbi:MAG: hypothetical protein ACK4QP_12280, partial [Pseudorhizobium sp.]
RAPRPLHLRGKHRRSHLQHLPYWMIWCGNAAAGARRWATWSSPAPRAAHGDGDATRCRGPAWDRDGGSTVSLNRL